MEDSGRCQEPGVENAVEGRRQIDIALFATSPATSSATDGARSSYHTGAAAFSDSIAMET